MLTLPAGITNYYKRQKLTPVLLIDFEDIPYRISNYDISIYVDTKTDGAGSGTTLTSAGSTFQTDGIIAGDYIYFTSGGEFIQIESVDSETQVTLASSPTDRSVFITFFYYNDHLKEKGNITLSSSITDLLNDISAVGNCTLRLVGWSTTLRSTLIGSTPDLTDSRVSIRFGFDGVTAGISNSVKIFDGVISSYKVKSDEMTVMLKAQFPNMQNTPENLLTGDIDFPLEKGLAKPLQYGDFDYSLDTRYWADFENLHVAFAKIPFIGYDSNGYKLFQVSDHEMYFLPTAAQLNYIDNKFWAFLKRDNKYIHLRMGSSASITNTSSGSVLTASGILGYLLAHPDTLYDDGVNTNLTNAAYAIDGQESTYAERPATANRRLMVHNVEIDGIENNVPTLLSAVGIYVEDLTNDVSGVYGYLKIRDKATDTEQFSVDIDDTDGWFYITSTDISFDDINDYYFTYEAANPNSNTGKVYNLICLIRVQGYVPGTDDPFIYLQCQGREFSGTWNTRKTAGNLIQDPQDMIESILRDEFGLVNAQIDDDTFDEVNDWYSDASYTLKTRASIRMQMTGTELIKEMVKAFGYGLAYSWVGRFRLLLFEGRYGSEFSGSGTSTAGATDIFTDSDDPVSGVFTNNPILKDSLELSRTDSSKVYGVINYLYGDDLLKVYSEVADSDRKDFNIENRFIADEDSMEGIVEGYQSRLTEQAWICQFDTGFNALGHELGDIINIRHSNINDDMLPEAENSCRWMIIGMNFSFRPARITIKAVSIR